MNNNDTNNDNENIGNATVRFKISKGHEFDGFRLQSQCSLWILTHTNRMLDWVTCNSTFGASSIKPLLLVFCQGL